SARLVGPLVLHERVTVAEAATIVGPSVLGAGCRIGRGAIVAHSVLARNTVVAPGSAIRERFLAGRVPLEHAGSPATSGTCQSDLTLTVASSRRGRRSFVSSDMSAASRGAYQFAKRAVDIGLAVVGLLLLLPLLVVIAILIKLDARGPVLFAHGRERRGGKEFPCWKFRTMVADAHARQRELYRQNEVDGPQFKLRQDPRVTRVGRYLRMTNIDELPQLFNVLLGHMSIVGPRPSPFRENQICVPWRRARLSVRPGITGLWQICRDDRGGGDFHQWIYYDLMYVRHCSVRLDIKILGATLLTLGGRWRVPLSWLIPSEGSVRPLASPTAAEPALIS
ncbi:MAG TPA: sugar transferase, partial [Phycisphaerae bacterium]